MSAAEARCPAVVRSARDRPLPDSRCSSADNRHVALGCDETRNMALPDGSARTASSRLIVQMFDIKINSTARNYAGNRLRPVERYGASARTARTTRIHTMSPMKIGDEYASAYV